CNHQTQNMLRSHELSAVVSCRCIINRKIHFSICCVATSMTVTAKMSIFSFMKIISTLQLILTSLMLQAVTFHHQTKI
ncbi:hypothetical protein EMCG_03577, partial [[Emmonsia] crescens]